MTDGVGHDAAKDAGDGISEKPSSMSQRLLGALVPHGDDDGQAGCDGCFSHTEHDAVREQAGGIEADGGQHQDDTPDKTEMLACTRQLSSQGLNLH